MIANHFTPVTSPVGARGDSFQSLCSLRESQEFSDSNCTVISKSRRCGLYPARLPCTLHLLWVLVLMVVSCSFSRESLVSVGRCQPSLQPRAVNVNRSVAVNGSLGKGSMIAFVAWAAGSGHEETTWGHTLALLLHSLPFRLFSKRTPSVTLMH